ncbi:hypothetical protein ACQR1W_24080 [Bradyrhizobium sp. HKCCYLS1011]|uniref:hypothetical protein n=1 Tax=Bradyrhizobium sp. HKCCYLS1011 TaxID=3420733 RepID=UPI003EB84E98
MTTQAADVKDRIAALNDKQAIHIANSLVQAAFSAPTFADLDDRALLGKITNSVKAFDQRGELEALGADPDWTSQSIGGRAAGDLARQGLQALSEQPGGRELVARALDEFFDAQADFGILTGAAAIGFVWLILSGGIEFKIGSFSFKKAGLSSKDQASIAPAFIREIGSHFRPAAARE